MISPVGGSESTTISGRTVSISFSIYGYPSVLTDAVSWRFTSSQTGSNGMDISQATDDRYTFSPDRLTLTISNSNLQDDGMYTLMAGNPVGNQSSSVTLRVVGEGLRYTWWGGCCCFFVHAKLMQLTCISHLL